MKILLIIGFWALLLTGAASAQQPAAPPASSDVRISALEQQVSALKSEVEELKAALTAAAPAPAAAQAAAVPQTAPPPAPAEVVSTQGGQIPVYGGATGLAKALNPDISVIGDFLGSGGDGRDLGSGPLNFRSGRGDHANRRAERACPNPSQAGKTGDSP